MTYNLGTKKGKRIYYGSLIFAALVVLGVSIMMLKLDFGRFSVIISKDVVNIEAPLYSTSINVKNIKEIKIIDNLDVNLRTNGAATDKYAIGHFELGEYGNSRIYIYDKNGPYIMLKLTNEEYIFISGTTNEETEKYYNELIKIY